ncbi:MAG: hypothetical protein BWY63_02891 [Chloroflexi bacterium ADurb.Bin360]|nr:MAG: hypothetical protein BWY63_02891 [Chloroflexi bacterium ADurb.Bin360]
MIGVSVPQRPPSIGEGIPHDGNLASVGVIEGKSFPDKGQVNHNAIPCEGAKGILSDHHIPWWCAQCGAREGDVNATRRGAIL